ncbi:MAG: hypothetical protein CMO40_09645 [Verrucomicrobiaceae bacterium]|nr:hypothetical protein [Verrucomicrobiaceae bacterium]
MSRGSDAEFSKRGCLISGLWTLLSLPFWVGAAALLVVSTTVESRLFAAALICFLPVPLNFLHWHRTSRRIITILLIGAGATALFLCAQKAPGYSDDPQAKARTIYRDARGPSRFSPVNLVPEVDQQILRSYLTSALDPNLSWSQAARLRADFISVHDEMQEDLDLAVLPSVLGSTYRATVGLGAKAGPVFVYVPEVSGSPALPAIVFLHDRMGNSHGYWTVWKKFADTYRYAIVSPTFGTGNWSGEGGLETIEQARQLCIEDPRINEKKLILAGISNGTTGVTRGGRATPGKWQGLLFISPVIEKSVIESEEFKNGWGGRRALIITGEQDRQTPSAHVRKAVSSMADIGMEITTHYLEDAHHFLFLSEPEQVSKLISGWVKSF